MHIVITQHPWDFSHSNEVDVIVEKSDSLERWIVIDWNAYNLAELEAAITAIKTLFT